MKKIFTSTEEFRIGHLVSMLEAANIDYSVRNQYLAGAFGELPATECWPEIWITHDDDYDRAMELVREISMPVRDTGSWLCVCGEGNEGQFGSCWKCGAERPASVGE